MLCANQKLEPVLREIAIDTGVPGTEVQRVRDRLFAVVPNEAVSLAQDLAAKVAESAGKHAYHPANLAVR